MSDICSDYWAASYIGDLVERGIINGYPLNDDTFEFRPENEITSAEMIKLIVAALELPLEENFDGTAFADWSTVEDWAKPYIGATLPLASAVFTVTTDSQRAIHAEELADMLRERGGERLAGRVWACGSAAEAVTLARELALAESPDAVICAFGSMYYISHIGDIFKKGSELL